MNFQKIKEQYPKAFEACMSDFAAEIGMSRSQISESWLFTSYLYSFFDKKGLILQIAWENMPTIPHFRMKIAIIRPNKGVVTANPGTWYTSRSEAENAGFEECFDILNVQLNE